MKTLRRLLCALFAVVFCFPGPAYGLRPSIENGTPSRVAAGVEEGAEETREAGGMLRRIFTDPAGRVEPVILPALKRVQALGEFSEEERWVRAFLLLLDGLPRASLPASLLSVPEYRAGPFTHGELIGTPYEESYLEEEWLPSIRKALAGVAGQVLLNGRAALPEELGLPDIEKLMRLLFYARGADGKLLTENDDEARMYRWSYRELPRLLVPLLAAPSVDREALGLALENPFRISNDEGNDAVQRAIGGLLRDPGSGFTDDPILLQRNRERLRPWLLLTLAANLVDYSRPSILEEISKEGGPDRYILNRLNTPFLRQLGGDHYIGQFLQRLHKPNTRLVHLPDNNAELAASLKLAEALLSAFPSLRISMIVKADNGAMNDGSMEDARRLLREGRSGVPDLYARLRAYARADRFRLIAGAPMHGTPLDLLPQEALSAIAQADVVLSEGEANAWNLNGLAKTDLYLGLRLKWPQGMRSVFGLSLSPEEAAERPPAFFRIDGTAGPYYRGAFSPATSPERRTILQTLSEQSHDAEETYPQRVTRLAREMKAQGWIASAGRFRKEWSRPWYLGLERIQTALAFEDFGDAQLWKNRLVSLSVYVSLMEQLFVAGPGESRLKVLYRTHARNRMNYHARIHLNVAGEPLMAFLRIKRHSEFPRVSVIIPGRGQFRIGRDEDLSVRRPLIHLDIRDRTRTQWWSHRNLVSTWSNESQQPLRIFNRFQERLIDRIRELALPPHATAGLEELVRALEHLPEAAPGSVGPEALVFTWPETFDLAPLALQWGWKVAVLSDAPEAEALRRMLERMPSRFPAGSYAIGTVAASEFLDRMDNYTFISGRQQAFRKLGLPLELEGLPEPVAAALQAVRRYLAITVSA